MTIELTADQQAAYAELIKLVTTDLKELVIVGFAGTGKTTLVKTFLDEWDQMVALSNGAFKQRDVYLTATTNKAADALCSATGRETSTVHSFLGLRVVNTGFKESKIVATEKAIPNDCILIIDEASFIDEELLKHIKDKTEHCKVVYIGDPCQLKPVGSDNTPVFTSGIHEVNLRQIVRQADTSPIQTLSKSLRDYVEGSPMPKAGVDGIHIYHQSQQDFEQHLINACRIGVGNSVRALTWTNQKAIYYNNLVAQALSGVEDFKVGDTVVVNKQVSYKNIYKFSTDSTVQIRQLGEWEIDKNGITSRKVETTSGHFFRHAKDQLELAGPTKEAYSNKDYDLVHELENFYVDLRLMFASTVNKSQGSTYETVFIDLNDIGKCRDHDQVRRMLYVAVSRAKSQVIFTGDI